MIEYIYHIADIHIRLDETKERKQEYESVFQELYVKLQHEPKGIIVICGDILHHKDHMNPLVITMTSDFLRTLSSIMKTIIILGNHDVTSNEDSISAILKDKPYNILLLKDHYYEYQNINFCLTQLDQKTVTAPIKNKFNVGLYHGIVDGCKTDSNKRLFSTKTIGDFVGYDIVLLGDIHKFQYLNKEKTICYCGSLIQQNHGENIDHHGYVKWNVLTKYSELIPIKNDYGYMTITSTNGTIVLPPFTIKYPRIRFITDNKKNYNLDSFIQHDHIKSISIKEKKQLKDHKEIYLENDIESNIRKYCDTSDIDPFISITRDLIKDMEFTRKINKFWTLKEIRFKNMFSYGNNEEHVINFNHFNSISDYGNVIGIIGENYAGKTSIIDIILYGLFGKCTKEQKDIQNKKMTSLHCTVDIEVGLELYRIVRETNKKIKHKTHNKDIETASLSKFSNDNFIVISENKLDIKKKLNDIIGTYEDFTLLSCTLSTSNINIMEVLEKSACQIQEKLSTILGIDSYTKIHDKALLLKKKIDDDKNKSIIDPSLITFHNQFDSFIYDLLCRFFDNEISLCYERKNQIMMDYMLYVFPFKDLYVTRTFSELTHLHLVHSQQLTEIDLNIKNIELELHKNKSKFSKNDKLLLKLNSRKTKIQQKIKMVDSKYIHDYHTYINFESIHTDETLVYLQSHYDTLNNILQTESIQHSLYTEQLSAIYKKIDHFSHIHSNIKIDDILQSIQQEIQYQIAKFNIDHNLVIDEHTTQSWKSLLTNYTSIDLRELLYNIDQSDIELHKLQIEKTTIQEKINSLHTPELQTQIELCLKKINSKKKDQCIHYHRIHEKNIVYLQKINNIDTKINALTQSQSSICNAKDIYNNDINILQLKKLNLTNDIIQIEKELEYVKENDERILHNSAVNDKHSQINENKKTIQKNIETYIFHKSNLISTIVSNMKEHVDYMSKFTLLQQLDHKERLYSKYIKVMSPLGIQKKILEEYEDIINEFLNEYVENLITYKLKINLHTGDTTRSKITLNLIKDDYKISAHSASGYEKFIINMAFKQALCDVTQYIRTDLYIQDEGFGVVDDKNLEQIDKIFEYFRKNNRYTIIASHVTRVTHNYDSVIHVKNSNGFSSFTFENNL